MASEYIDRIVHQWYVQHFIKPYFVPQFINTTYKRIEFSDAILVVNVNNYIGDSTNLEIDYAKKLGKKIIYYTDLIKDD